MLVSQKGSSSADRIFPQKREASEKRIPKKRNTATPIARAFRQIKAAKADPKSPRPEVAWTSSGNPIVSKHASSPPFPFRSFHVQVSIVEDDPAIAKAVRTAVLEAGHECTWVPDGETAIRDNTLLSSDIVVLDLMLPKVGGLDVLRAARSAGVRTPVIVLTAVGTVPDKLAGFDAGADDYLVKPFAIDELLARIEAVHRRTSHKPAMELEAGDLHLSLATKRLALAGRSIDLTPTEFSILELLMRFRGQVVTRKMLCEHVWGFDWDGPTNVIEVHINRLRGKLDRGRNDSLIRTIRGRGYALASG
jgi:two-component system OmpR family response regulator/two-component system copper resistance phosphate regulon response regulator CusR